MRRHVQRQVEDKRVLRLIRRYFEAGVMSGGIASRRQGGPLSPLLSNILLNELDRELERRGHESRWHHRSQKTFFLRQDTSY